MNFLTLLSSLLNVVFAPINFLLNFTFFGTFSFGVLLFIVVVVCICLKFMFGRKGD